MHYTRPHIGRCNSASVERTPNDQVAGDDGSSEVETIIGESHSPLPFVFLLLIYVIRDYLAKGELVLWLLT